MLLKCAYMNYNLIKMSFVLNYIKIPIKIPMLCPVQVYYFLM